MTLKKYLAFFMSLLMTFGGLVTVNLNVQAETNADAIITVDFSQRSDPPLIKKIDQYNAGCLPYSNYDRDLPAVQELDPKALRIDLSIGKEAWCADTVTGSPGNLKYDFTLLDELAKKLNARNILPYYSWCYIPKPLQSGGIWKNLNEGMAGWQQVWQEIYYNYAKHYKDNGIRLGYQEIYNEPDLEMANIGGFLDKSDFLSSYFDMYKYGVLGLKSADPDAVVGGPAYAIGEISKDFIDFAANENLPMDFFSFHNYMDGNSWPNELNIVRDNLDNQPVFKTTEIHLNEFSWFPGGDDSDNGPVAKSYSVPRTFEAFKSLIDRPEITMVNWAQTMNAAATGMGLIDANGHKRAMFNAFKVYQDMPVERVNVSSSNEAMGSLASAADGKAALVVWNNSDNDMTVETALNNLPFGSGTLKVYRIDSQNASYGDGAHENLEVEEQYDITSSSPVWSGTIPAKGTVYITIVESGSGIQDFTQQAKYSPAANDIRALYNFEDRTGTNYEYFDRKTWRAYIGMGSESTARSLTGVEAENLPDFLNVQFRISGSPQNNGTDSMLDMRIDFKTGDTYTKSVLFHGGIYNASGNNAVPWGTKQAPDEVVQVDLSNFQVDISQYAPTGWSGRASISFEMKNTGAGSRAEILVNDKTCEAPVYSLYSGRYTSEQVVSISAVPGAVIRYTTDGTRPDSSSPVYTGLLTVSAPTIIKSYASMDGKYDSMVVTGNYIISPEQPVFDPKPGLYTTDQMISIMCETEGAVIRYTTDGSEPDASSAIYSEPIPVTGTTVIKAIASKPGLADSLIATGEYYKSAESPLFSLESGSYLEPQSVSISCSTPDAIIRYTTDGSNPDGSAPEYTGPITVSRTTTLKAIATKPGLADSTVTSALYNFPVVDFVGTDATTQGSWKGVYGADGYSIIQSGSSIPAYAQLEYSGGGEWPWEQDTTDIRALQKPDSTGRIAPCRYTNTYEDINIGISGGIERDISIYFLDWDYGGRSLKIEAMDPFSSLVYNTQTVSNFSSGVWLKYRVRGNIKFRITNLSANNNTVFSGVFFGLDYDSSKVRTPVFSPAPGRYDTSVQVAISSPTPDAIIRYTTDGSDPDGSSQIYAGPITVFDAVVKAYASKPGSELADSDIAIGNYIKAASAPVFNPVPGIYNSTQDVILTCATEGSTIRYTTDGSDPNESSAVYTGPIPVTTTTTIKAFAANQAAGLADSVIVSGTYKITPAVPTFVTAPGVYKNGQSIALVCATEDAIIRYTTDGSLPDDTSILYEGPILVTESTVIRAFASKEGMDDSEIVTGAYTIQNIRFEGEDTATSGMWIGKYGTDGYAMPGVATVLPSYAQLDVLEGNVWNAGEWPPTAYLQNPGDPSKNIYSVWYNGDTVSLTVSLPGDAYRLVSLYLCDNDGNRVMNYEVFDPVTGEILDTRLVNNFKDGLWLSYAAKESIGFRVSKLGGANSIINGVFFDTPANVSDPVFSVAPGNYNSDQNVIITSATDGAEIRYTTDGSEPDASSVLYTGPVTISETTTLKAVAVKSRMLASNIVTATYNIATLSFAGMDITTQGSWKSKYGSEGYSIINGGEMLPDFARLSYTDGCNYTRDSSSHNKRALQKPDSDVFRIASYRYTNTQMSINVGIDGNEARDVSIYFADYLGNTKSVKIEAVDCAGKVLDERIISKFHNGIWLKYKVKGNISFRITSVGIEDAVFSGVFFD